MKTECLKKILFVIFATVLSVGFIACQNQIEDVQPIESNQPEVGLFSRSTSELPFLQGADLSYINELQDGGVKYYDNGNEVDPYRMLKEYGGNLVRLRLWHNPTTWTQYSTLSDVKRSIGRAKAAG